jgi:intracellular multiplication protein IcmE
LSPPELPGEPEHPPAGGLLRTPLAQSLANSRRLFLYMGILGAGVFSGGYILLHHGQSSQPHSSDLKSPNLDAPAGGNHRTPLMDGATNGAEQEEAKQAKASGASYAGSIRGKDPLPDAAAIELGDVPGDSKPRPPQPPAPKAETAAHAAPAAAPPAPPVAPAAPPASSPEMAFGRPPDHRSESEPGRLSVAAQAELLAAWSGHRTALDMNAPAHPATTGAAGQVGFGANATTAAVKQSGASADGTSDAAAKAATDTSHKGPLLLQAGRGVYGHAVNAPNSDLDNKVLVEIDSGPLVHDRISGTFQMKNDRLLIHFDHLIIGDAPPISVSAYAVSPDTAEAGVASDVNQHIASRVLIEAAAGFVSGLGSAAQSSNTTSVSSGLGVSSFAHLTLPEQMLAGAGQGAQALSQSLQKIVPQQDTVILRRDAPVGVIFDDPVYGS